MTVKRVLIIDDEDCVLAVVQGYLEDIAGWDVLTATSAPQGLTLAIAEQPDAIILDVSMPRVDGVSCLRQLKADSQTQAIPVILLTANVEAIVARYPADLKVAALIAKPFDPMTFVQQVASALGWKVK